MFLDALRKATGRIEYWWPELRDDGTLKMEWRYEREVVIPIPEGGVGYSWGHGRPERVLVLDLMNLDFDLGGDGGGKEVDGVGVRGVLVKGEAEEEMDFKSEEEEEEGKGCVRMADVPVYCPPPTSPLPGHSEYGFEEMMGWILQKQGPGVVDRRLLGGGDDGHGTCDVGSGAVAGALEAVPCELQTTDAGVGDEWDEGDGGDIL